MAIFHSFRAAARNLLRAPLYLASVVLCLGLGLGSSAAIYSVVDAFMLRPLPFSAPERLLLVWKTLQAEQSVGLQYFLRPGDFEFARETIRHSQLEAAQAIDLDVHSDEAPERLSGAFVTGNLQTLLGLKPRAGRLLTTADEVQENPVVVVTDGFASRRFRDVESAVGKELKVDGRLCSIVGVIATESAFPDGAELWLPLTREKYGGRLGFSVVARLRPGISAEVGIEEIESVGRRLTEVGPNLNTTAGLEAEDLQTNLVGDLRPTLLALMISAGCFLLIACANAACLALARARSRDGDMGVRTALGATRWALSTESLAESLLLGVASATVGLTVAWLVLPLFLALSPAEAFSFAPIAVDARVVLATGVAALLTSLLVGMVPVVGLATARSFSTRKSLDLAARVTRSRRAMSALIVVDIAITAVLMIAAGLMLRTAKDLSAVDPGFDAQNLVSFGVSAPLVHAEEHRSRVAFFRSLIDRTATIPGVESSAVVQYLPMTTPEYYWGFSSEDHPPEDPDAVEVVLFRTISPEYFETLGVALAEGRFLRRADDSEAPRVIMINEAMAERYWPNRSAVGRRLKSGTFAGDKPWVEIVGVVRNHLEQDLATPPVPALYFPQAQRQRRFHARMHVLVRKDPAAPSPISAVRSRIRELAPTAVIFDVEPVAHVVDRTQRRQRFSTALLSLFALLGLFQAAAGLYGVMSYDVASRVREFGVRVALGARPWVVRRSVLNHAISYAALGLAIGCPVAVGLSYWVDSLLVDVGSLDPTIVVGVIVLTFLMVVGSSFLPARRAAALDPSIALERS